MMIAEAVGLFGAKHHHVGRSDAVGDAVMGRVRRAALGDAVGQLEPLAARRCAGPQGHHLFGIARDAAIARQHHRHRSGATGSKLGADLRRSAGCPAHQSSARRLKAPSRPKVPGQWPASRRSMILSLLFWESIHRDDEGGKTPISSGRVLAHFGMLTRQLRHRYPRTSRAFWFPRPGFRPPPPRKVCWKTHAPGPRCRLPGSRARH